MDGRLQLLATQLASMPGQVEGELLAEAVKPSCAAVSGWVSLAIVELLLSGVLVLVLCAWAWVSSWASTPAHPCS